MATYSELMAQAQALMAQAEQARKAELANVIADIKAKMKEFDLSFADLGGSSVGRKASKAKAASVAKFRGPNGELWSGGPGRKPDWVREALAAGKDIEAFRI